MFSTLPVFGRVGVLFCTEIKTTPPLHHSQRIVEETDDYTIFSWRLKPSYDFIQQLLTMNAHIEVLEPISLRENMKGLLQEMLGKY